MGDNIIDQLMDEAERLRKKSVTDIIEEVKNDICDNLCKYPVLYPKETFERSEGDWYEIYCTDCPLERL